MDRSPDGRVPSHEVLRLRSARIVDADGNPIEKIGMLAFGTKPNPDAEDGTYIGRFLDVTRRR
jgi:hypothetical protein